MASASDLIFYQQGTPIEASAVVTYLGLGSVGTPDAKRILTHPNATPALAPITYWGNPHRDFNIDNDVLTNPRTVLVPTETTTKLGRFDSVISDRVVREVWLAGRGASMPSFFLRQLLEYVKNHPSETGNVGEFITWEPRDRNARKWNVEIVGLQVGGDDDYDFKDVRARGGVFKGGSGMNGVDSLSPIETGLVDRDVVLSLKIVSEVV